MGPHHRPVPQPMHRGPPAAHPRQPVDHSVPLGPGAVNASDTDGSRSSWPSSPSIAVIALGFMSLHFMKLPAKMFGVGRYTVTVELPEAAGLYGSGNVTYRGVEVGRVEIGAADRYRRRGGAVAEIRHRDPVGSASRGAQPVGDRRTVRPVAAPQRHLAAAEERRRDSAGRHQRAARHQHHPRRMWTRPEGDAQGQPQDRRSTSRTRPWAGSGRNCAASSTAQSTCRSRRARISTR